ncbi:MAG: YjbQ family protein [Gammaproteobacteria bacterium]|nr:YjbQ family protein [Gammaproteobacteria bacterium]
MTYQKRFSYGTRGRGTYEITDEINQAIHEAGIETGICHVFIHHTSASLTLCENADASVRQDLESFMAKLVPDGDPMFSHTLEGPDDMAAHVRAILTKMDLTIPVAGGRGALGTWQGIYLWEHRTQAHRRNLSVTILGD